MSWFGWLTKGHYEISLLDRLIGFGEFFALMGVLYGLALMSERFIFWNRRRIRRKAARDE